MKELMWRGDGVAERASLENWRPRKGSASSNLAPSANNTSRFIISVSLHFGFLMPTTISKRSVSLLGRLTSAHIFTLAYTHTLPLRLFR